MAAEGLQQRRAANGNMGETMRLGAYEAKLAVHGPSLVRGCFRPELKSKPFDPHSLFASFIEAAVKQSRLV
jgi:CTP synthase (UTP-ammonia lyase)